jgi:hypothetical protein
MQELKDLVLDLNGKGIFLTSTGFVSTSEKSKSHFTKLVREANSKIEKYMLTIPEEQQLDVFDILIDESFSTKKFIVND